MARVILTAAFVKRVTEAARYGDGHGGCGLSLLVKPMKSGPRLSKTWSQRIRIDGRVVQIGLGSYPVVSLRMAREKALHNARLIAQGIDPRAEKTIPTFAEASEKTLVLQQHRSPRASKDWRSLVDRYCQPVLRMKIDRVTSADLLALVTPVWMEKRATGQILKVRLNQIFQWSIAQGHRTNNPTDGLSILPRNGNGKTHRRSLPYTDLPAALEKVKASGSYLGLILAFELLVLTAARSGETRKAAWNEIDFDKRMWTIPASHMKTNKPHRVPLSPRCMEILQEAKSLSPDTDGLIFPSQTTGRELPDNALSNLCKTLEIEGTPHGFRSSFRIWSAEQTDYPRELAELALSHNIGSAVEAAYQRSDLIEQRRQLMQQWADFVISE